MQECDAAGLGGINLGDVPVEDGFDLIPALGGGQLEPLGVYWWVVVAKLLEDAEGEQQAVGTFAFDRVCAQDMGEGDEVAPGEIFGGSL